MKTEYKTTRSKMFLLVGSSTQTIPQPVAPEGEGWELVSAAPTSCPHGLQDTGTIMFWTWRRERSQAAVACPQCGAIAKTVVKATGHYKCIGCGHLYKDE